MCSLVNVRIIDVCASLAKFSASQIDTVAWACRIPEWFFWMIWARVKPSRATVIPILVGRPSMMNFVIPGFGRMSVPVMLMLKSALMIPCWYRMAISASVENGVWGTIVCLTVTSSNMNLNSAFSFLLMVCRSWSSRLLGGRGSATEITISLWIFDVPVLKMGMSCFFYLLTRRVKCSSFLGFATSALVLLLFTWLACV